MAGRIPRGMFPGHGQPGRTTESTEVQRMSLFSGPEEHAANPPESWQVVKVAPRCWHLTTAGGVALGGRYTTKTAAEQDKTSGFYVNLYGQEARWYAGEPVTGWKPYADVAAARERNAARWAART